VEQLAEQAELQRYLITSMNAADPTFFTRFKAAATSGNHLVVRAAIDEAGDLMAKVLTVHPDPEVRAAVAGRTGDVVQNAEMRLALVIVIVVYAAVAVWDWKWGPDSVAKIDAGAQTDMATLKEDQLVDLVAMRLHLKR
jgi:SdpC family antimicrobial peptide